MAYRPPPRAAPRPPHRHTYTHTHTHTYHWRRLDGAGRRPAVGARPLPAAMRTMNYVQNASGYCGGVGTMSGRPVAIPAADERARHSTTRQLLGHRRRHLTARLCRGRLGRCSCPNRVRPAHTRGSLTPVHEQKDSEA